MEQTAKKIVTMPFLVRSTRDCITILKPKFITDFLGHDHERHYIDFALLEGRVGQANFGDWRSELIPLSAREQKARAHQGLNGVLLSYEVEYQHKAVNMCLGGRISGRCCEGSAKGSKVVVPLIGASSSVKILDFTAQVELKQRYENQVSLFWITISTF